jgi:hypothetical protein
MVGCTTGSRGEVPGERKQVITDDGGCDDNNSNRNNISHHPELFHLVHYNEA